MDVLARVITVNPATVADRWKGVYLRNGAWGFNLHGNSQRIYEALVGLGPNARATEVDALVGNNAWTGEWCNGCHEYGRPTVQIGEELDCESATVTLCPKCVKQLHAELTAILAAMSTP
jgi:hypothetical protein